MNVPRPFTLFSVMVVIVLTIYFINAHSVKKGGQLNAVTVTPRVVTDITGKKESTPHNSKEKATRYELAKEITTPDGFVNTAGVPITINSLIGKKVILIDFWTYSCINCQRTTPYLNAWYEKYKDKGLEIIGVHTPEFEFEKEYANVKTAVEKLGIQFPVVLDNDYSTWTAYKNQYWPRKYLIDIDGYVVYDHIGEGGYEETEKKIQEALTERMAVLGEQGSINQLVTKEIPLQEEATSPETYFGATRNHYLGNGSPGVSGIQKGLVIPSKSHLNALYLSGDWDFNNEFAQNSSNEASIVYTYKAKDVFFVAQSDTDTVLEVLRDGKPLEGDLGSDIVTTSEGKTVVTIRGARLYKIIQGSTSETHTLKFLIKKPGFSAFTFTFG